MTRIDASFLASFWTLAGPTDPMAGMSVSTVSLEERADAAAEAGFSGFAFIDTDLAALRETRTWKDIRGVLASRGLAFIEVELVTNWFAMGELKARSDEVRDFLFEAAQELGADHLKIIGDFSDICPVAEMVDSFGALCAKAAGAGTRVAIELTPLTNLWSLDQGLDLIGDSGASNAGLLLDVWHIARAGIPYEEIGKVPADLIYGIELDDADLEVRGTLREDTLRNRRLPGEGELKPARFIAEVHKAGYLGPYGIEILSDAHRKLPVREQARLAIASARGEIEKAERMLSDGQATMPRS
jgi:sugar phosphate isomerase/epimerase